MSDDNHDDDNKNKGWGKPAYKVGYGKPPKQHQFKKGQSGNPRGRKPRVKNASTLLQIELDKLTSRRAQAISASVRRSNCSSRGWKTIGGNGARTSSSRWA